MLCSKRTFRFQPATRNWPQLKHPAASDTLGPLCPHKRQERTVQLYQNRYGGQTLKQRTVPVDPTDHFCKRSSRKSRKQNRENKRGRESGQCRWGLVAPIARPGPYPALALTQLRYARIQSPGPDRIRSSFEFTSEETHRGRHGHVSPVKKAGKN
eukprot:6647234-Pyramimonas_sp.AAC.2